MEKSFIEVQFPVSKISKESYKERKAAQSQTLTGLGKWWGRKPLILVRATILGLLMPSSDDLKKDMEVFLKILSMDDIGLFNRKDKNIPLKVIWNFLKEEEKNKFLEVNNESIKYKDKISKEEKINIQKIVFNRMSYDEKLQYCLKAENSFDICEENWRFINNHLNTSAKSIQELIMQLGIKKFGNVPRVGDCFSGGGSIPFEAARIGCDSYASDLNPIAALLSWSSINVLGINKEKREDIQHFLECIYNEVNSEISELEQNENGDKALAFLYCTESYCPECGWKIPLATTWVVGERAGKVIAILEEDCSEKKYNIKIKENATKEDIKDAIEKATIKNNNMVCPHCGISTSISSLRRDFKSNDGKTYNKLRKWKLEDIVANEKDIYEDRLYCIRWERSDGTRYYNEVLESDKVREKKVIEKLKLNIHRFNEMNILPTSTIEPGVNTSQLILERGWLYWRNLFNPRQLLINGLIVDKILKNASTPEEYAIGTLALNRCCDYNSKLCRWDVKTDAAKQTFYNQAFNTLFNYGSRSWHFLRFNWFSDLKWQENLGNATILSKDAKDVNHMCDIWITDPPYADAINYHELSEFFIAWDKLLLTKVDKNLYGDSKRILAVKGVGNEFNENMVNIYSNLTKNMPDNGLQVVMFTHQDVSVWANLTKILWKSGLKVSAAWNIATETDASGIKKGNYIKGTVLLVLRKQESEETVFLDELYPEIKQEVKIQIDSMRNLDDKDDPNFTDADYLLAAYAASLKVLTSYKNIEDMNIQYELSKSDSNSSIANIINQAVKIAFDYLIPNNFDSYIWKNLIPEERFYIKGLETEKENVYKLSAYQELGRGFGVKEYSNMMANNKANKARLKTASEFAMKYTNDNSKFGNSVLRNILIALYKSSKEEDATKGKVWLKNEIDEYWNERNKIISILEYISTLSYIENMKHWEKDAKYAKILVELIKNDGI